MINYFFINPAFSDDYIFDQSNSYIPGVLMRH